MIWILYTAILALAEANLKPASRSSLDFLVVGDWGGKPTYPFYTKAEKSVAAAMGVTAAKISSKFTIGLGDNFYYNGVTCVNDPRFQTTFEKVFTAQSLQSRWYMVCGNHDHNGNASAQVAYTKLSKRWYMPSLYYTKTIAIPGTRSTVQFIFIDTVILAGNTDGKRTIKPHPALANDELNWITETLKHSKADWVIVAGHYPVLSASSYGQIADMVEKIKPLLEKYGVTAYFAGHHHNLQHIKERTSDVHYFISGAGHNNNQSTKHASVLPPGSLNYFYDLPDPHFIHGGYASVSITQTFMVVTFYNESGNELYRSAKIAPRKRKHIKKCDV